VVVSEARINIRKIVGLSTRDDAIGGVTMK
jgi:hypothetical protein